MKIFFKCFSLMFLILGILALIFGIYIFMTANIFEQKHRAMIIILLSILLILVSLVMLKLIKFIPSKSRIVEK